MKIWLHNLGMLLPQLLDSGCSVRAVIVCICKNCAYQLYDVGLLSELFLV